MPNQTNKPITVSRGEDIESTHDLHIAVTNVDGELLAYYGNPHRLTFARSSMKPIQAVPVVESGAVEEYGFTEKEVALFSASHSGEPFHIENVRRILQKMSLTEENLQCGTHIPKDIDNYKKLIHEGGDLTPVYSNCSGKHSGMLAGCLMKDMDINTYHELSNPYQQEVMDVIADMSDYDREKIKTGVDGCGVPVHRVPLNKLAMSFGRLARPKQWRNGKDERIDALGEIRDAMMRYPEMVAGTDRFDTDLMNAYKERIVAKGGAEGVHCFGDKESGIGVAIKVEDGNGRGTSVASMEVLRRLGIGDEDIWRKLEKHANPPILNTRNETIGLINAEFELNFI